MKYGTLSYLLNKKKEILMLKKYEREDDPNSGGDTLPGGKLFDSEKGLDNLYGRKRSVSRETKDETGIIVEDLFFRGTILFDNKERIFKNWNNPEDFFVSFFEARAYSGNLKPSDEGIPYWLLEKDIFKLPISEGDVKMYEWLASGMYFSGVIHYTGTHLNKKKSFVEFF